ncbi:hypothetical protein J6590_076455 [Homalodisca vitripennis]|nr:hypothetical protein J6590_076455 [Homalodisca vitripennis]
MSPERDVAPVHCCGGPRSIVPSQPHREPLRYSALSDLLKNRATRQTPGTAENFGTARLVLLIQRLFISYQEIYSPLITEPAGRGEMVLGRC